MKVQLNSKGYVRYSPQLHQKRQFKFTRIIQVGFFCGLVGFFSVYLENIPVLVINLSHYIQMSTYQRNGTFVTILRNQTILMFRLCGLFLKRNVATVEFVVLFGKSRVMNLNTQVSSFPERMISLTKFTVLIIYQKMVHLNWRLAEHVQMSHHVAGECACNSVWCTGPLRENLNSKDIKSNNEQALVSSDFTFFFHLA